MRIKVEEEDEESLQQMEMISEEPRDSDETMPMTFGAEEAAV